MGSTKRLPNYLKYTFQISENTQMAKVDLHNFFQFYDEKNPNHVKGIQWLEDNLPITYLEDNAEWAEIYRGKKTSATVAPVAVAPPAPVPAWDSENDFPASGLKLIKEFEGCHLTAYPDPLSGNLPITIGWGTTRKKDGSSFKLGDKITQKAADDLLMEQCKKEFLPSLRKIPGWKEMTDGQRGSLLSFAYNLGAGFYGSGDFNTITKRLKNKEWDLVPDALYLYRNPGSNVEAGLARRRKAEGESWKKG
jgi:lysozyme